MDTMDGTKNDYIAISKILRDKGKSPLWNILDNSNNDSNSGNNHTG